MKLFLTVFFVSMLALAIRQLVDLTMYLIIKKMKQKDKK